MVCENHLKFDDSHIQKNDFFYLMEIQSKAKDLQCHMIKGGKKYPGCRIAMATDSPTLAWGTKNT